MKNPTEGLRDIGRGVQWYIDELKRLGVSSQIPHFNDVITGRDAPAAGIEPAVRDVIIDGWKVDVYHWGGTSARVYLYKKEKVE